jgi:release factor glutamine methyltransferase
MTIAALLALCRREMASRGLSPLPDAEILVSAAAGIPRFRLVLETEREIGGAAADRLKDWLARRTAGEPVQYTLGSWDFCGREFRLTRDTLIPRPETEGLVMAIADAWRRARRTEGLALDVGTGCGAIAVTLAAELPRLRAVATDVSGNALLVARENARRHGVADRVRFLRADLCSALQRGSHFDLVVSNPPYVSEKEWQSLPAEVRDYEPPGALLAGPDGLAVLRRLAAEAGDCLSPGGALWCEIGETQGDAVGRLPCGSLRFDGVRKDLARRDRVARWTKR